MEELKETLRQKIKQMEDRIEKFQKELSSNPQYALEWSLKAFEAAATLTVSREILKGLENDKVADLTYIKAYLTKHVLRNAKYPTRSTSPTANLAEQCLTAAYAEALDEYFEEV